MMFFTSILKQAVIGCLAVFFLSAFTVIPQKKPFTVTSTSIDLNDRTELSDENLRLYVEIFQLQEYTHWRDADILIKKLSDNRLMPYVLFQRYLHPTSYRSSYTELESWLKHYRSYAGAGEIYQLAVARKPASAKAPLKPIYERGFVPKTPFFEQDKKTYRRSKSRSGQAIKRAVLNDLKCCGAATKALGRLSTKDAQKHVNTVEIDTLKGHIAKTYLYLNYPEKAYKTASEAVDRSDAKAPFAAWVAGLAAWRLEKFEEAAKYFEISALSEYVSPEKTAASAYWASRAFLRTRQPEKVNYWLSQAATEPRTFYGLVARRALGWHFADLEWRLPVFKETHLTKIKNDKYGFRAYLLLKVGQRVLAEQELMKINPKKDTEMEEALLAFAAYHKLPALLYRMSTSIKDEDDNYYNAALYPQGAWEEYNDHAVDEALIHGFIRQESRFDPHARSHIGASGLMQIMPSTAEFMTGEKVNGKNRYKLLHPDRNVDIGSKYIKWLLGLDIIENNLFKMVVSYNAGQGNMARWWKNIDSEDDPLLFIESIPVAETRHFVEKVMANFWLYRISFGQDTPSLTQVAKGEWPLYKSLDE